MNFMRSYRLICDFYKLPRPAEIPNQDHQDEEKPISTFEK